MNYLVAFLMIKDETRYLKEWVAFHRTQGFEKFYIYDNMSAIPVSETMSQEIKEGLVETQMWEDNKVGKHHRAMDSFLDRTDIQSTWAALIDTDEFAFGLQEELSGVLHRYENEDAVKLEWMCFGSSGHLNKPEGMVIESFTKRGEYGNLPGAGAGIGKSIVKFGKVKRMSNCHTPRHPHRPRTIPLNEAVINHYVTRSKQEWSEKSQRGAGNGEKRGMHLFGIFDKELNKIEDKSILKWAQKTKDMLK